MCSLPFYTSFFFLSMRFFNYQLPPLFLSLLPPSLPFPLPLSFPPSLFFSSGFSILPTSRRRGWLRVLMVWRCGRRSPLSSGSSTSTRNPLLRQQRSQRKTQVISICFPSFLSFSPSFVSLPPPFISLSPLFSSVFFSFLFPCLSFPFLSFLSSFLSFPFLSFPFLFLLFPSFLFFLSFPFLFLSFSFSFPFFSFLFFCLTSNRQWSD